MRIGWISNCSWSPVGYGRMTALVTPRLKAAGHEMVILANYGLHGGRCIDANGILTLPPSDTNFSFYDVIEQYRGEFGFDLVISHWDVWPYPPDFGRVAGRWVPWLPIDREPLSILIERNLQSAYWVLPWCKHASKTLTEAKIKNQTIVPLCIDTKVNRILDGEPWHGGPELATHAMFKKAVGGDEKTFVVGMVAANMDTRKNIDKVLGAVKLLKDDIPELKLALHAPHITNAGLNLPLLFKRFGLEDRVFITPKDKYHNGLTPDEVANLYNTFDVIALPSSGEGWGLPLTEANACGVIGLYTNFTAMPEVAYGVGIDPVGMQVCQNDHSYQACVSDKSIADALFKLYKTWRYEPEKWAAMRLEARAFAEKFDADKVVAEYWLPTLAMLEEKIQSEAQIEQWLV